MCQCQSEETSWSGLEGGSESFYKDVNTRSVLSTGNIKVKEPSLWPGENPGFHKCACDDIDSQVLKALPHLGTGGSGNSRQA